MKRIVVAVFLLLICACEEAKPICGDLNSENPNWLQDRIEKLIASDDKYSYALQGEYNGETVFTFLGCNPAALYALIFYRCNGEVIEGPYNLDDLKNQKVIWRPVGSKCNFN